MRETEKALAKRRGFTTDLKKKKDNILILASPLFQLGSYGKYFSSQPFVTVP